MLAAERIGVEGEHMDDLRCLNVTLEEDADGHLYDGLGSIGILVDFVEADVVLAIFCACEVGHVEYEEGSLMVLWRVE